MKHGITLYSRGCRCDKCLLARAEHDARPTGEKGKPTARESLRSAIRVQDESYRILGIATKIRKGRRRSEFEAVHWPEICCQKTIHVPAGRAGACAAHRPFGRS